MAFADNLPINESLGVFVGVAGMDWLVDGQAFTLPRNTRFETSCFPAQEAGIFLPATQLRTCCKQQKRGRQRPLCGVSKPY